MSINRVTISGNMTRDPEVKMTASGTAIMNFGVAVNDRRKNSQTGQWEDVPNFVDCVLFGQRANSLQNILHKGFKVAIDGKLRQSTWQDKNTGQNRSKLEVIVDDLDFMTPKGQQGGGYQQTQQPAPAPTTQPQQVQQVQQVQPVQTVQQVQQAQPVQQVQATTLQTPAPAPTYVQQADGSVVYDSDIPF